MGRYLCALALVPALSLSLWAADRLVIVPAKDRQPTLQIPSDFLGRHQVKLQEQGFDGWRSNFMPTIMAGLALTIGAVLLGLTLARRRAPRMATGCIACSLGLLMFINSSCSPRPQPHHDDHSDHSIRKDELHGGSFYRAVYAPQMQQDGSLQGEVLMEEASIGDSIRLTLDADALKALAEHQASKPKQ